LKSEGDHLQRKSWILLALLEAFSEREEAIDDRNRRIERKKKIRRGEEVYEGIEPYL
jgi:hypothetical protein